MTQDLYYVESGYLTPDAGYYVYTADAEAAVSSASTISCDATKIAAGIVQEGSGNLNLVATMAVVISHIHGADLVAFSNAAIATEINVIRTTNIALTSVFSAAIDAVRGIYVTAQADATATISIANLRVRTTEAAHSAAFSLAADVTKIVSLESNSNAVFSLAADVSVIPGGNLQEASAELNTVATISVTVGSIKESTITLDVSCSSTAVISHIHGADLVAFSNAAIATEINVIKSTDVALSDVFSAAINAVRGIYVTAQADSLASLDISNNRVRSTDAAVDVVFSLDCSSGKVTNSLITTDAIFTELVAVAKTGTGFVQLDSVSSMSITAVKTLSITDTITSQFAILANAGKRIRLESSQVALSSQSTQVVRTRDVITAIDSQTTIAAVVGIILEFASSQSNEFTSTVDTSRTRDASVSVSGAFSPTLAASVVKNTFAVLDATSSLASTATIVKNAQATISGAFAPTCNVFVNTAFWSNLYHATTNDPGLGDSTIQYVSPESVFTDSSNNLISLNTVAYRDSFSDYYYSFELVKYNQYGNILWQRRISDSTYNWIGGQHITKGPSNTIFVCSGDYLFKFNSDGDILWQKGYSTAFCDIDPLVDSEGNVYTFTPVSSQSYLRVVKFNGSTGAIISQQRINTVSSTGNNIRSAVFDRNGELIITWNSSGTEDVYLAKINVSTWTIVWAKQSTSGITGLTNQIDNISVDLNNNIYFIYKDYVSGTTVRSGIAKYNSSGVFQWFKYISHSWLTVTAGYPDSVFYDEISDRLYSVINRTDQFSDNFAALDTNGNIKWQNQIGYTSGYNGGFIPQFVDTYGTGLYGIVYRSNTSGTTTSYRRGIAKVPLTGTGTASEADTFFYSPSTTTSLTTTTSETTAGFATYTTTFATDTSLTTRSAVTSIDRTPVISLISKVAITPGSYFYTASSSISSALTVTANAGMIKGIVANLTSSASQTTDAGKIHFVTATLSSTASMTTVAAKNAEIILTAFGNASLTSTITRVRDFDSTQASEFAQTISADRFRTVVLNQSSAFTQDTTAVKTVDSLITTDAIFTELVAVARTGAGFVQLDVQAIMATTAIKTTDVVAPISSEFAQTTAAVKSTVSSAALSSATALDSTITRIRNQVLVYAVNSQLEAEVGEIEQFNIDLTAVSILSCETGGIREAFADISSQASVVSTILRIRDASSSLASEFAQTTLSNNSRLVGFTSTQSAQANVTAAPGTIKTSAVTTDAIFTELAAVAKTGQGFITLDVVANQTATAVKTTDIVSNQTANATVTATVGKIVSSQSTQVVTAGFTATGTFVTTASANFSVAYTLVCNVVKTVDVISLEASAGTLVAQGVATKRTTAALSALAFELAVGSRTQTFTANLTATASVQARVGGTFGFQSAMQGFAAEVAVIDIIHIDAKLTWMIFADDRDYSIQSENRTYSIVEEDRDYSIVNEDREYAVTRELLTTELQGV